MLEIKFVRENPKIIKNDLKKRGFNERIKWVDDALKIDEEYRKLLQKSEKLRHRRNEVTNEINLLKKQGKSISATIKEIKEIPDKIKKIEEKQEKLKQDLDNILKRLPNILHKSVPVGDGEEGNKLLRKFGSKPKFSFTPKSHVDLLESLDIADTERAAKISGARFYFLKRDLVMLDYALMKFALDILDKKDYILIEPPLMIRRKPYEGVTDLDDFEDVIYKIKDEDLYLIATSE
ncbi:serine--tRNA ligase, partial [Candidatus Woesearchaeota archaeon]|nr:serine--tRNA ligase [Candidatus Woesearchaeota archaeon]